MANTQDTTQLPPVPARVLAACAYGKPDDVAEIPADEIEGAKANGQVDDHPDAVAYARSLQQPAA